MIVFYSWQSDLPPKCNRSLIQDALQKACKDLRNDETIEVQPVLDRDTQGASGAVGIADTIFEKITKSDVFVADVTQIGVADQFLSPLLVDFLSQGGDGLENQLFGKIGFLLAGRLGLRRRFAGRRHDAFEVFLRQALENADGGQRHARPGRHAGAAQRQSPVDHAGRRGTLAADRGEDAGLMTPSAKSS